MQYPLNARADLVGPTVNPDLEHAVPLYRQEDHQIQAAKAPPISIALKSRPITHQMVHQLQAAPTVVLSRSSNQNPANAGQEHRTSVWSVSDPFGPKASFLNGLGASTGGTLLATALGIGIGYLLYRSASK